MYDPADNIPLPLPAGRKSTPYLAVVSSAYAETTALAWKNP
jgi:hypothetical protein